MARTSGRIECASLVFEFRSDGTLIMTIRELPELRCQLTAIYQTNNGIVSLTLTGAPQGSMCGGGFPISDILSYALSGDMLTLTSVDDESVWGEFRRIN